MKEHTEHTRTCYVQGCRHPQAKVANAAYRKAQRERIAQGAVGPAFDRRHNPAGTVDAAPVKAHLVALRKDFSLRAIAAALDGAVCYETVRKLSKAPAGARVAEATATAILDLEVTEE